MPGPQDDLLREALIRRLHPDSSPLPRSGFSPTLAYGRHRGPYRSDSRHAAVLISLYRDSQGRWNIPLTRRPSTLKHHAGQICLPGGQLEAGESPLEASLREFQEELGVEPTGVAYCGELDTQYVYNSDNRVHPVVVLIDQPKRAWRPDPIEVAEVIVVPVNVLLDQTDRSELDRRTQLTKQRAVRKNGQQVGSFQFRADVITYQQHQIWGATAVILDQLARVMRESCLIRE